MSFKEGDYFYIKDVEDGKTFYSIFYCLKLDQTNKIAHVALYEPCESVPSANTLDTLNIYVMHIPIQIDGFDGHVVFSHKPVSQDDLTGYFVYLKNVDFQAYLEETGQDFDVIGQAASEHFHNGNALSDKKKFEEAIVEFKAAIDLIPHFFEAIDNLAFAYMDLGRYEEAISCFEQSIAVNQETFLTCFSIAECLLQLGNIEEARKYLNHAESFSNITEEERTALAKLRNSGVV